MNNAAEVILAKKLPGRFLEFIEEIWLHQAYDPTRVFKYFEFLYFPCRDYVIKLILGINIGSGKILI
jgi:hypothetical protein